MKIGFDAKRAFHNYTGLGNYSRFIIEALLEFYPENQYRLYTPTRKDNPETRSISKANIIEAPSGLKLFKSLWRSLYLFSTIEKGDLEIYHGLSNELPAWGGSGIKKVVTIHDLIFLRYPELYNFVDRKIYYYKFKKACQKADVVIAISKQTKADIVNYLSIPEKKIKVVYQGYHEVFNNVYTPGQLQGLKTKYALPEKYMLNVGTVETRKNVLHILKAMATMDDSRPLVIIGRPTSYQAILNRFIAENNLASKVLFLPDVSFADLPALYQMAELFIYPSLFEGFGIPIIEAHRSGTPVITSTGSCFKEAGGEAAYYTSPTDHKALAHAMRELTADNKLKKEMIRAGEENLKQFSKQKIASDIHAIYQSLLKDT